MPRLRLVLLPLVSLALVAGCTSSSSESASSTSASTTSDPRGGVPLGYPTDVDALTPLVISGVVPDPIPVTGTDGKVHVVYELEVLNFSPRAATLTRLETLAGGPDGEVVSTIEADDLAGLTIVLMDLAPNPEIPPGRTAVVLVDDVYDSRADVPASVVHRLTAELAPLAPEYQNRFGALWPTGESASVIGGPVSTSAESPVVIGPPLAGPDWFAGNACCGYSSHRNVILPVAGRINGAERYAVDWSRWDSTLDPAAQQAALASGVGGTFRGDPTRNENYLAYDATVLAVADGTVVRVVSGVAETEPGDLPAGIGVVDLGGNVVIIDIGNGVYASYLHLATGSTTVEVGDEVTRGEVIARLGNSGNTSEAHLHFQLQRSPAPFPGDNVPFEIDTLTFVGSIDAVTGLVPGPNAGPRVDQLPLHYSVVDFPALP